MKRLFLLSILLLVSVSILFGQGRKKRKIKKGEQLFISAFTNVDIISPLNYYDESRLNYLSNSVLEIDNLGSNFYGNRRTLFSNNNKINLGFAIQKVKSNNTYSEFALTKFALNKSDNVTYLHRFGEDVIEPIRGSERINFEVAARYEYGKYFIPNAEGDWQFGLGVAVEPYYMYKNTIPKTSLIFPLTLSIYGAKLLATTSISRRLTKNARLELKLTPDIINFNQTSSYLSNPILTEKQRKSKVNNTFLFTSPLTFNLLFKYQILGKKASKKKFKKNRKKRPKISDAPLGNKITAVFVIPFLNVNSIHHDYPFNYIYARSAIGLPTDSIQILQSKSKLLDVGLGFQFVRENSNYFNISLTRFSQNREFRKSITKFPDTPLSPSTLISGSDLKTFDFGFRYEFGKVFGDPYNFKTKMRFALGLGLEPYYFNFKLKDIQSNKSKFKTYIFGTHLSIIPTVTYKFSHRLFLNLKWTPVIYKAEYRNYSNTMDARNPTYDDSQNKHWFHYGVPKVGVFNIGMKMRI